MQEAAKKRSLQEITEQLLQRLWRIDEADGEISEECIVDLEALETEQAEKIDRILFVVEDYEAKAYALKQRAQALSAHARRMHKDADWLKQYIIQSMEATKISKIECENHPMVSIRLNPPSLGIDDPQVLISEDEGRFVEEYIEHRIDKKSLKEALKAGEHVPGAYLFRNKKLVY